MANSNSQILKNISDSIKEANEHVVASYDSSGTEKSVRDSIQLMVDNVGLLVQCSNEYGCHANLSKYIEWIKQLRSKNSTTDFGNYKNWIECFVRPELCAGVKRSLAVQIELWARSVNIDLQKKRKPGSKERGRPPKYSDQTLEAASRSYEQCMSKEMQSGEAWAWVADTHGFPSPKSAYTRVREWEKKQKMERK